MTWTRFEPVAPTYDRWYGTRKGRRADRAERELLGRLLARLPGTERILEIGCGTGHFASHLVSRGFRVVGLDRSPAMLAVTRTKAPSIPAVLADAHRIPLRDGAVDAVVLVTALEFLENPDAALAEAVRVARRGVVLLVLNPWSVGGLSRRFGPQSRQPILGAARDRSLFAVRVLAARAAGSRLDTIRWTSILFPGFPWRLRCPIPFGDVLGLVVRLHPPG